MSLLEWIGSQFMNPRGFVGKIIANAMEKHNRIIYEWVLPMCVHEGDAVLEIGFGHGLGLNMIARQYKPSLVHGIDISSDMCKAATARLKHDLPAGSNIFCGDALSDSRLSQYDCLLAVNIVYFWNDLFLAARKLAGLTRPGGRLCLYMVSPEDLRKVAFANNDLFNAWTVDEVLQALQMAGFRDSEWQTTQIHQEQGICILAHMPQ